MMRLLAMVRFHARSGARLALAATLPVVAAAVVGLGLDASPSASIRALGNRLLGGPADLPLAAAILLVSLLLAVWAAGRVRRSLHGWIRHLPAGGATHRRAALAAVALAQAPVGILLAGSILAALPGEQGAVLGTAVLRLAGLPLLALACGMAALPVKRRLVPLPAGLLAAWLAITGEWSHLVAAVAALALADRRAGEVRLPRGRPERHEGTAAGTIPRLAWRSVRWQALGPLLVALLPLAGAAAMTLNNDLGPAGAASAARLGAGLAFTLALSGLADLLALRRPIWPWSRSLPWSSAQRVRVDAMILAAPTALLLPAAAWLDAGAAAVMLPAFLLLSLRAATHLRDAPRRRTGASGRLMVEGLALSGLLCLVPWLTLGAALLLLPGLAAATAAERRQKVSLWAERAALPEGEPQE